MQEQNIYIAIDLKSFYASVECVERNLNPLTTNLVVADTSRTEKTICLAVSPSLKEYGIPGRLRLFEVIQKVREINTNRKHQLLGHTFKGKSIDKIELKQHPEYELDYIAAPPQMNKYMQYSTKIYNIYLKYFSPDDIYVYSIDEVFIDVTHYLKTYQMKASSLATKIMHEVYEETGITSTCGVGTNLYLAKVALDIEAKHAIPNKYGVRIACLDENMYKRQFIKNNLSNNKNNFTTQITYFISDDKKEGGKYVTITDTIYKIDEYKHQFIMKNGLKIDISEILDINVKLQN